MPVKYTCPKCGRRFTQWGAEKAGFKCPSDEWTSKDHPVDVELVRMGPSEDRPTRRPALKKGARKLAVSLPAGYGDDPIGGDPDEMDAAADFPQAEEAADEVEGDEEETFDEEVVPEALVVEPGEDVVVVDAELGVDIDLGDAAPEDEAEASEETIEEEWHD